MAVERPSVRLAMRDGRWVCESANASWSRLGDAPGRDLEGEPVGALLLDRFVAEALGRLCDLAALTSTPRRLLTSSISGAPRVAVAVPDPSDGPTAAPPRVVLTLDPSPDAPATVAQMGQVLDAEQELVAVFDRSLRVVDVNEAVCEVSGMSREELLGRTNLELGYPPELAAIWDEHHRQVMESGLPRLVSYDLPTVLGPRRYESLILPGPDASGQVSTVVVASLDVTREHLDDAVARRRAGVVDTVSAMWKWLEPAPSAAATARREVTAWLATSGLPPSTDVELVASELVANAAMHAGTPLYLHAQRVGDRVRLEVHDGSSTLPVERHGDGVGGRGLALVRALSSGWGAVVMPGGGKSVWCEVEPGYEEEPAFRTVEDLLRLWSAEDM